jgi:hypothetical protein
MLISVAVVSISLAWLAPALDWIAKRDRFAYVLTRDTHVVGPIVRKGTVRAPGGLWLLGEKGIDTVYCHPHDIAMARTLFPEANVQPLTKEIAHIHLRANPPRQASSGS